MSSEHWSRSYILDRDPLAADYIEEVRAATTEIQLASRGNMGPYIFEHGIPDVLEDLGKENGLSEWGGQLVAQVGKPLLTGLIASTIPHLHRRLQEIVAESPSGLWNYTTGHNGGYTQQAEWDMEEDSGYRQFVKSTEDSFRFAAEFASQDILLSRHGPSINEGIVALRQIRDYNSPRLDLPRAKRGVVGHLELVHTFSSQLRTHYFGLRRLFRERGSHDPHTMAKSMLHVPLLQLAGEHSLTAHAAMEMMRVKHAMLREVDEPEIGIDVSDYELVHGAPCVNRRIVAGARVAAVETQQKMDAWDFKRAPRYGCPVARVPGMMRALVGSMEKALDFVDGQIAGIEADYELDDIDCL